MTSSLSLSLLYFLPPLPCPPRSFAGTCFWASTLATWRWSSFATGSWRSRRSRSASEQAWQGRRGRNGRRGQRSGREELRACRSVQLADRAWLPSRGLCCHHWAVGGAWRNNWGVTTGLSNSSAPPEGKWRRAEREFVIEVKKMRPPATPGGMMMISDDRRVVGS